MNFNVAIFRQKDKLIIKGTKSFKEFNLNEEMFLKCAQKYAVWENNTKQFRISGLWNPRSFLENADIPPFSKTFYSLCFHLGTIPDPEQFFNSYFQWNCEDHGDGTFDFKWPITRGEHGKALPPKDTLYVNALKHRITRCYPSLFREVHALYELSKDPKINFEYQWEQDVYNDTDLLAFYKGRITSISLYNKSLSSSQKRNEKESRHDSGVFNQKIKILADFKGHTNTKRIGSLDVYGDKILKDTIDLIIKEEDGCYVLI